jgi:hypothetical protein
MKSQQNDRYASKRIIGNAIQMSKAMFAILRRLPSLVIASTSSPSALARARPFCLVAS